MFGKFLYIISALSVAAGVIVLLIVPSILIRSKVAGSQLLNQDNQQFPDNGPTKHVSASESNGVHVDGLIGRLQIPKLNTAAPIVQGTDDKEINVAVGHLATSVLPGQAGTCLLAAHNATWFRHIDRLKPGDEIEVTTVTGHFTYEVSQTKVVRTDADLPNSVGPSLDLESCYPLDALYLTPYRYIVTASLMASTNTGANLSDLKFDVGQHYLTSIPARIKKEGISLQTNPLPMGTLTYSGSPADGFIESDSPINAASQMVNLYLAMVHASSDRDTLALKQLLPYTQLTRNPLFGCSISAIRYIHPYDIELVVNGNDLLAMEARTTIEIDGRTVPVSLQATLENHRVTLVDANFRK